ncbi:conserved hypothetical protein [Ricinus communis]|uniref:Uncharacterized protein n=1 Tax=Ricinus communis TaxID=3988 RepID=B9SGC8_RICCO|nr:conserved hypothetical protein [Ricinus communis]
MNARQSNVRHRMRIRTLKSQPSVAKHQDKQQRLIHMMSYQNRVNIVSSTSLPQNDALSYARHIVSSQALATRGARTGRGGRSSLTLSQSHSTSSTANGGHIGTQESNTN